MMKWLKLSPVILIFFIFFPLRDSVWALGPEDVQEVMASLKRVSQFNQSERVSSRGCPGEWPNLSAENRVNPSVDFQREPVKSAPTEVIKSSRWRSSMASLVIAPAWGLVAHAATYPLERVKFDRQRLGSGVKLGQTGKIYRDFVPYALASTVSSTLGLGLYGATRDFYSKETAAWISGFSGPLSLPFWNYRTQLEKARAAVLLKKDGKDFEFLEKFLKAAAKDPLVAWRGMGPSLLCILPYGAYYQIYEELRKINSKHKAEPEVARSLMNDWIAGALAKVVVSTVIYPLDTARVKLQEGMTYSELFDLVGKEGAARLYRGFLFGTTKSSILSGLSLASLEKVKNWADPQLEVKK